MKIINWELMKSCIEGDTSVMLENKVEKLMEESGELAQAHLALIGSPNTSASVGNAEEEYMQECCDVLNVAIDIAYNVSMDIGQLQDILENLDIDLERERIEIYSVLEVGAWTGAVIDEFLSGNLQRNWSFSLLNLMKGLFAMLSATNFTEEEIYAMFDKKLGKWKAKQLVYNI